MSITEQSDPMDQTVSGSDTPREEAEGSYAKECGFPVPLVSLSSAKAEMGFDGHSAPAVETKLASGGRKEVKERSSVGECVSLAVEIPASESGSVSLQEGVGAVDESVNEQQCCVEINNYVCSGDAAIDVCKSVDGDPVADVLCKEEIKGKDAGASLVDAEGDSKNSPESDRLSDVECWASRVSLNELNFNGERISYESNPVVPSPQNVRFSREDCLINSVGSDLVASQEQSFFDAAIGAEVGGLCFPHDNNNLSVGGNMKPVTDEDLSDAVKCLQDQMHLSPRNGDFYEKTGSDHMNVPSVGNDLDGSDLHHDVSTRQHPSACVLKDSSSPPENAVRKFVSPDKDVNSSLQSCAADLVLGSGSPGCPASQEASKLYGVLDGSNSVPTAEAGDVQLMESNEALFSLRRSCREKKCIQKSPDKKYARKGSKKALSRAIGYFPVAVRGKRSCSNRAARMSNWGLIETLSKHIELNSNAAAEGSGSGKGVKKSRRQGKVQAGAGPHGAKARNRASSGHIRLKLKLVSKEKSVIEPIPLVGTNGQAIPCTDNDDKHLDLRNNTTEEVLQKSLECFPDMKLEKSATSLENSRTVVHSADKDLEVAFTSSKCSKNSNSIRNSSDKEAEKSGGSTDDRHLNSGTSPDSEVIQVPESQSPSKVLEVHDNNEMDSSKATPAADAVPAMSKKSKKKGSKKEKLCQLDDFDAQNRLLGVPIKDKTKIAETQFGDYARKDVDDGLDVGHEPEDSWKSKKLLPPAKGKGNRKSRGSKSKSELKPSSAPGFDIENTRRGKGDKWKLIGNYSIGENWSSDQAHRKEDNPEATTGKHGVIYSGNDINITGSGVATEDLSSVPLIPDGVGQPIAQPRVAWVCCDDCLKWRCISSDLADIIDETNCRWACKDNQDKAFADCSIPQEKSNADINAELNITDDEEKRDISSSGKRFSMKQPTVPQQSSWMLIKSNIFLHRRRKTQTLDEIMVCHCKPSRDGRLSCGDQCLNRMLNIECVQGTCPCGDLCANQQFQRQGYANLSCFRSGKKGYGLQVQENVKEGQFLIEYVGEVLDLPSYEARQREYASNGHKHFYFMTLNGSEVIDACAKGNLGRFINHSCDPNCRTEKWMVNGEICIGIFAVRDIKKGEELTFDYNYVRVFGAAAKKCHCGSTQCRGYIGGDRLSTEVIVQGDSDEEFPEPVAVYENGEIADELNIMSKPDSLDVMTENSEDILLQGDIGMVLNDNDAMNTLEESMTSVQGQLPSIVEKDGLDTSMVGFSQSNSSLEGSMSENVGKATLDVVQEKPIDRTGMCTTSPKRSDSLSLNKSQSEPLSESVEAKFSKPVTEVTGGKAVHSKARPRMKMSRPSKSAKGKVTGEGSITIDKALLMNKKSQSTPSKLKKPVETSAKHRLETVEEKLNELLDKEGGICKRKDAFKGYLRLLVQTAASGDCGHHQTIQSNKDLSMILDAILKTKSRTVLTDILNKNGLQMLHSMMKKCRGNFNMIPILRKLLKVFEFLAERNILTVEHINGDPPRPGMESFRDSILTLTEHEDRKVHQIARAFRDRWIPRISKKFNCMEKGDWNMDFNRASSCSRLLVPNHLRCDQAERPSESLGCIKQSLHSNHFNDSDGMEASSPCLNESLANTGATRKRKSRWDQPSESVSPHSFKEQRTEQGSSLKFDSDTHRPRREDVAFDNHLGNCSEEVHCYKEDDERQETEDDAPPGFSCPSFGGPHLSNNTSPMVPFSEQYPGPLICPSDIPKGYPKERYNSDLPISYAIPLNSVQEFGTPQACTGDGWVIAPGMPFRPFPPLPLYPRERLRKEVLPACNGVVTNGNAGKSQDGYWSATSNVDQDCPSSSTTRLPNLVPTVKTHLQSDSRHSPGRSNSKRGQNNSRNSSWGSE